MRSDSEVKKYFIFFVFIFGGCMSESKLIAEIKSIPKPGNFEHVRIDSIVEKYFEKGMPRENVISTLRGLGFSASSQEKDEGDTEFFGCDESVLVGVYELKKTLSPLAGYKVVIYFGFEKGFYTVMKAVYLKNMY